MRLNGKKALVTGGGSGIGRATAMRFAEEGASVVVTDVNKDAACAVVRELTTRKFSASATTGDVSNKNDAKRMVAEAVAFLGGLDILVNNAGVGALGTVTTISDEDWDRTFAVNVNGIYQMSKFAIPEIMKAGGGAIVNIASLSAMLATKNLAAYCASKGAVLQLTRSMAADHAPAIRVNCVCPGPVDTPMLRGACSIFNPRAPERALESYARLTLLQRLAQPEEIASCVLFLASDDASYVTGHALIADAGTSTELGPDVEPS